MFKVEMSLTTRIVLAYLALASVSSVGATEAEGAEAEGAQAQRAEVEAAPFADGEVLAEELLAEEPLVEDQPHEDQPHEDEPLVEDRATLSAEPSTDQVRVAQAPTQAAAMGPAAPAPTETSESLSRRIQAARKVAQEQQKRVSVDGLPKGLAPEELAMGGAERNVYYYDKQIYEGQGTPAIEAFRRLALETLANARRRQWAKVFGATINHPDSPGLLREHARRVADLRRIRFLAEVKGLAPLKNRADELLAKAGDLLRDRMAKLGGEALANGQAVQGAGDRSPPSDPSL